MMRKLGDVMRVFAWCLVVAGVVIGSISVSYATYETTTREAVWIRRELSSQNAVRLRRLIHDVGLGDRRLGGVDQSGTDRGLRGQEPAPRDVQQSGLHGRRGAHVLWTERRFLSSTIASRMASPNGCRSSWPTSSGSTWTS